MRATAPPKPDPDASPVRSVEVLSIRPETTVAGHPAQITVRCGSRDYAGWFTVDDPGGIGPPLTPPMAYIVEKGRERVLGPGIPIAWSPGRALVAKVRLKPDGKAAGWEDGSVSDTFIYTPGRAYDLGRLFFMGRRADGTAVLWDSDTEVDGDHGRGLPVGIYLWRQYRLVPWVRLPQGWRPMAMDAKGGMLVRRDRPDREHEDDARWEMAILRGRTLSPVRFVRPKGSWGKDCVDTRWLRPDGRFRIGAEGEKEVDYVFSPVGS